MGKKLVVVNIDSGTCRFEVNGGEDILIVSSHGADRVADAMLDAAGEYPGHAVYGLAENGSVLVNGRGTDHAWALRQYRHDAGMQSAMEDVRIFLMESGCRKCESGQSSLYYMADTKEEAENAYAGAAERFGEKFCIVREPGCRIFVFPADADSGTAIRTFCKDYGYGCMRCG